jgi:hypothetical protein
MVPLLASSALTSAFIAPPSSNAMGILHHRIRPPATIQSSKQQQTLHPLVFSGSRIRRFHTLAPASSSSSSEMSSNHHPWTRFVTGVSNPQRPGWARDWMPTWLVRLRPSLQLLTVLLTYIFHMTVLAQRSISFPFQLIPNDRGHFQSIGWDS